MTVTRWSASEPDGPHAAIYRAIGIRVRDQLQGVDRRGLRPLSVPHSTFV